MIAPLCGSVSPDRKRCRVKLMSRKGREDRKEKEDRRPSVREMGLLFAPFAFFARHEFRPPDLYSLFGDNPESSQMRESKFPNQAQNRSFVDQSKRFLFLLIKDLQLRRSSGTARAK